MFCLRHLFRANHDAGVTRTCSNWINESAVERKAKGPRSAYHYSLQLKRNPQLALLNPLIYIEYTTVTILMPVLRIVV